MEWTQEIEGRGEEGGAEKIHDLSKWKGEKRGKGSSLSLQGSISFVP